MVGGVGAGVAVVGVGLLNAAACLLGWYEGTRCMVENAKDSRGECAGGASSGR